MTNANVRALAAWFREQGGRFAGAVLRCEGGRHAVFATRDLARGETVMTVPRHLILSVETARHSPIGLRLQAGGVSTEHAYMAAFLAETRRHGGHWRPMVDAVPQAFADRPECFDRHDWDLLRGSRVQALSLASWKAKIAQWRGVNAVLPREQRIALRDFIWGWQLSASHSFSLMTDGAKKTALVPLGEVFGHAPEANCTFGSDDAERFFVRTRAAVREGSVLTVSFGRLSNARLLTQYGMHVDDNPHDTVRLSLPLGRAHWLHDAAPELTARAGSPAFEVGAGLQSSEGWRLLSLLRLAALPGADAVRAHPELRSGELNLVPALDAAAEQAALQALIEACERGLAAFTCGTDADDELLAGATLTPRQRCAVTVRRGEKRLLQGHIALAQDAIAMLELPPEERRAALARRAKADGAGSYFEHLRERLAFAHERSAAAAPAIHQETEHPMSNAERALVDWFHQQGGSTDAVSLRTQDGLRGMVATRDLAKGEVVMRVPRHMYLTVDTARHSPIGLRLQDGKPASDYTRIGACMVEMRRHGGYWRAMVDATPTAFDGRPEGFSRDDWALLEGSEAQSLARAYWRRIRDEFRRLKAALPKAQRIRLREHRWAYQACATRTFTLTIDGVRTTTMVPLAEMFNHSNDCNCDWKGDHTRHFEVRTSRPVTAGTALTISYGALPNARLLAQYGFCLDDNKHDTACVSYRLERSHWMHKLALGLTKGCETQSFEIGRDPLSVQGQRLLSYLRLCALPGEDAARAAGVAAGKVEHVSVLGIANERAALHQLIEGCERALGAFTCGVKEDDALLAGGTLTWPQRCAVTVRRGEKQLLLQALAMARHALVALCLPDGERQAALERRANEGGPWQGYFVQLRERLAHAEACTA